MSLCMLLDLAALDFPPPPSDCSLPTVISDAAAGGQVLLSSATFRAVKELARDLGCVTKDGMQVDQLHQAVWWQFWRWVTVMGSLRVCNCNQE